MKILPCLLFSFLLVADQNKHPAFGNNSADFKLNLSEHRLTTNFGILIPSEIIKLLPEQEIEIRIPDGTLFKGTVTKTSMKEKYHFECFGELSSHSNAGFGFVITKDGIFGAIVMRDTDITYCVKYSTEANGYVLLKRITPTVIL